MGFLHIERSTRVQVEIFMGKPWIAGSKGRIILPSARRGNKRQQGSLGGLIAGSKKWYQVKIQSRACG